MSVRSEERMKSKTDQAKLDTSGARSLPVALDGRRGLERERERWREYVV
jgi:hypothetical protein